MIFSVIFCLIILQNIEATTISISSLTVDDKDYDQKTNNRNPTIEVGITDAIAGIATKSHPFLKTSSTLYLWHFSGTRANVGDVFDETSGGNQFIVAENNINSVSAQNTNFGKALYSGSTTEYFLSNNLLQSNLPTGTIEFWFKPATDITAGSLSTDNYIFYKGLGSSSEDIFTVRLSSSTGQLEWLNSNGSSADTLTTTRTTWSSGTWYYIALAFDSVSKKIYVNGALDNSNTVNGQIIANSNNFRICGRGISQNDSLQGYFDELRISSSILSPDQIFANYNSVGYKVSLDSGTSWTAWNPLSYDLIVTDGSTSEQAITFSTTTLNFISSYSQNKISFIAKNTNNEYTTSDFTILVDTITPNNVSSFATATGTALKKIILSWTDSYDDPGAQNVTSYQILYSTKDPANCSNITEWQSQAQNVQSLPTPSGNGVQDTFTFTGDSVDTIYYFSVRTYDGLNYSSYSTVISTISAGIKDTTNFLGTAVSSSTILWSWTDNSTQEKYFDIYDQNFNIIVSSLSANTTYYYENNLAGLTQYTRSIKARNDLFTTNDSSATATTLGRIAKDIDGDGYDEYYNETDNSLLDNNGSKNCRLTTSINNNEIFFRVFDRSSSDVLHIPTNVWLINDNYVTTLELLDVNGDGTDEYVYKSKGSASYDRIFNPNTDVDSSFGTLKGIVSDQNNNLVSNADVKLSISSTTLECMSDATGNYSFNLPLTYGQNATLTVEKNGYQNYQKVFIPQNGIENNENISFFCLTLDLSTDDIHNYPNPFSKGSTTKFLFNVKTSGNVKIYIYNVDGKLETKFFDGYIDKGSYDLSWDGKNDSGRALTEGLYYVIYKTGSSRIVKKVVIKS